MRCLIVIPARMGSTRYPGKPLVDLAGKPMVQWVYERALASGIAEQVMIATPDREIVEACAEFGAWAELTSHAHMTGTDRLAEVSARIQAEVYINVQGDEPLVSPASIGACGRALLDDPQAQVSSVMDICPDEEVDNPNVVKVVTDLKEYALYFSRYPVPFARNPRSGPVYKHVGLYAYGKEALKSFASWAQTPFELTESLEQLRFLEHGYRIKMARGVASGPAIDEPGQVEAVVRLLRDKDEEP